MRTIWRPPTRVALPTLEPGGAGARAHSDNTQAALRRFPEHWNNPDVRGALCAFQGCVCAYCGTNLPRNDRGDVEHFRPKSEYWWLAYALSNYVMSCSRCNRDLKRSRFPLRRNARAVTYGRRTQIHKEARLLLDPTVDDVESLFALSDEPQGGLSPRGETRGIARTQAKGTIDFFRLNLDVPLVRERVVVFNAALDAIAGGEPDRARQLAIRFRPHSIVARIVLLETGEALPSVEQEVTWQVNDLVARLDGVMKTLDRSPDDRPNRKAMQELLWSLAVLAKFPLGLSSNFVLDLLRSQGLDTEVQPYLAQL